MAFECGQIPAFVDTLRLNDISQLIFSAGESCGDDTCGVQMPAHIRLGRTRVALADVVVVSIVVAADARATKFIRCPGRGIRAASDADVLVKPVEVAVDDFLRLNLVDLKSRV